VVGDSGNDGLAIEDPIIPADDVSTVAEDHDDDSAPVIY
jgi:hypothetical protein